MVSLRPFLSGAALVLAAAFVFQACSLQSEAQRCELTNGHADCESGLTCQTSGMTSDTICCPPDKANATTAECKAAGSSAVVDSGIPETATTDTGTDTGTAVDTGAKDSATEAATDAGTDSGTSADAADAD